MRIRSHVLRCSASDAHKQPMCTAHRRVRVFRKCCCDFLGTALNAHLGGSGRSRNNSFQLPVVANVDFSNLNNDTVVLNTYSDAHIYNAALCLLISRKVPSQPSCHRGSPLVRHSRECFAVAFHLRPRVDSRNLARGRSELGDRLQTRRFACRLVCVACKQANGHTHSDELKGGYVTA